MNSRKNSSSRSTSLTASGRTNGPRTQPPNGTPGSRRKKKRGSDGVTVLPPWLPLPLKAIRSRRFAQLSPLAARLFLDAVSLLGANGYGNGDLCLTFAFLKERGWKSKASVANALRELRDAELLFITRQGGRRRCSLYALTLWEINCDLNKLDVGPGVYSISDWHQDPQLRTPPTQCCPAQWKRCRGKLPAPDTGTESPFMPLTRTTEVPPWKQIDPVVGPELPSFLR
jgi:hypothetical protein